MKGWLGGSLCTGHPRSPPTNLDLITGETPLLNPQISYGWTSCRPVQVTVKCSEPGSPQNKSQNSKNIIGRL